VAKRPSALSVIFGKELPRLRAVNSPRVRASFLLVRPANRCPDSNFGAANQYSVNCLTLSFIDAPPTRYGIYISCLFPALLCSFKMSSGIANWARTAIIKRFTSMNSSRLPSLELESVPKCDHAQMAHGRGPSNLAGDRLQNRTLAQEIVLLKEQVESKRTTAME